MSARTGAVARAFAGALFSLAGKEGLLAAREAAASLAELVDAEPALRKALGSPALGGARRRALIAAGLPQGLEPVVAECLSEACARLGPRGLQETAREFGKLVDAEMGVARVRVETAREIGAAEMAEIEGLARKAFPGAREYVFDRATHRALTGGFRLRSGSLELDASVRATMERMKQKLLASRGGE